MAYRYAANVPAVKHPVAAPRECCIAAEANGVDFE
jgi:hypothetical protein